MPRRPTRSGPSSKTKKKPVKKNVQAVNPKRIFRSRVGGFTQNVDVSGMDNTSLRAVGLLGKTKKSQSTGRARERIASLNFVNKERQKARRNRARKR